MFNFLKQPYKEHNSKKENLLIAILFGLFIFLFLFLFKPFGLSQLKTSTLLFITLGYGLVTFFVIFIFTFLLEPLIVSDKWTVGKNILWEILLVICIGVANFFYSLLAFNKDFSIQNIPAYTKLLLYSIWVTLLVGIIPSTIHYLISINRKYKKVLKEVAIHKEDIISWEDEVVIKAGNPKNNYMFNPRNIICISSNDNYITVVTIKGDVVNKMHIRGTLKAVESDLKKNSQFLRCHKCFIVNLKYVDRAAGNVQNMKLILSKSDIEIPVSRTCVPFVLKKIERS